MRDSRNRLPARGLRTQALGVGCRGNGTPGPVARRRARRRMASGGERMRTMKRILLSTMLLCWLGWMGCEGSAGPDSPEPEDPITGTIADGGGTSGPGKPSDAGAPSDAGNDSDAGTPVDAG